MYFDNRMLDKKIEFSIFSIILFYGEIRRIESHSKNEGTLVSSCRQCARTLREMVAQKSQSLIIPKQ